MSRVKRVLSTTTVPHAACGGNPDAAEGCRWIHAYSRDAREMAKEHAAETGHEVMVITETRDVYKREDDR